MKIKNKLFSLLVATLLLSGTTLAKDGIQFQKNLTLNEMIELAEKEGKGIFIDAFATWCGPCKYMSNNVFTDEEVGAFFNKNFINVKLDMESENGLLFDEQFEISAYPTLLFLTPEGKLIKKEEGSREPDGLIQLAEIALDPSKDPIFDLINRYETGDRSDELLVELVGALAKNQKEYNYIIEDYFKDKAIDFGNESDIAMFYYENSKLEDEHVQLMLKNIELFWNTSSENVYYSKLHEIIFSEFDKMLGDNKTKELKSIIAFAIIVTEQDPEMDTGNYTEQINELYDEMFGE